MSRRIPRPADTSRTCSRRSTSTRRPGASGPQPSRWRLTPQAVLAAVVLLGAAPSPDASPAVADVLAAYARALPPDDGRTVESSGTIIGGGLRGTFHTWRAGGAERDDESLGPRAETTLRRGDRWWVRNANANVRELTGVLLRRARTTEFIDSGAFTRRPDRVRLIGSEVVAGERAWRVVVTAPDGEPETLAISAASGLPLRTEVLEGDGTTITELADWHDVGGRRLPFRAVVSDGNHAFDLVEQTLEARVDAPIDPAVFAPLVARTIVAPDPVTVPLIAVGAHVAVTVTIAGKPYRFLVDSGAQNVLLDSRVAREAGLVEEGELEVRGAQRTGGLHLARLPRLEIGTAALDDLVVSTIDLGTTSTLRVDGILGYPFFAASVVELDFGRGTLRFGAPGSFVPSGERVALDVDREIPEARARFDDRLEAPVIVDTGNAGGMLLYQPFVQAHPGIVTLRGDSALNYGVGGANRTLRGELRTLRLGPLALARQPVDVVLATTGAFADRVDAGNIGLGLLRRFVVTFDLAQNALYLRPRADGGSPVPRSATTS